MSFNEGRALVIGVGSHRFIPRDNVPVTAKDAQKVAEILIDEQYCGYPESQVTLLHDHLATRDGIIAALDGLAKEAAETDTVFVYYAGHGEYDQEGQYALVSHDAKATAGKVVTGTGVSQKELLEKLKAIRAKRVLMIFNACHSGNIAPDSLGLGEGEALGGRALPQPTASAMLGTGTGRIVITACGANQKSWIGTSGDLTIFTQALVNGLRGEDIVPTGGYIDVFDLYEYVFDWVTAQVKKQKQEAQEPELTVLRLVGKYPVALYAGSTNLSLSSFSPDKPADLSALVNVRQVDEKDSKRMLDKIAGVVVNVTGGGAAAVGENAVAVGQGGVHIGGNVGGSVNTGNINTGGGAFVGGGISTDGGTFVGRDSYSVTGDGKIRGSKGVIPIGRNDQTSPLDQMASMLKQCSMDVSKANPDERVRGVLNAQLEIIAHELEETQPDKTIISGALTTIRTLLIKKFAQSDDATAMVRKVDSMSELATTAF